MEPIAKISINLPVRSLNKLFSYLIPAHLSYIDIGWRVLVPFGNRNVEGFVIEVTEEQCDESTKELKAILDILDQEAWFDEYMFKTACWISEYYLCSLSAAMRLFIPGKSGIKNEKIYKMNTHISVEELEKEASQSTANRALINYLSQNGPTKISTLRKHFTANILIDIQNLTKKHVIVADALIKNNVQLKYKTVIKLVIDASQINEILPRLKNKPAQNRLLCALREKQVLDSEELNRLHISQDTIKRLIADGVITTNKEQILRDSYQQMPNVNCGKQITLTEEQQHILHTITPSISQQTHHSYVLHGITGSGKTQIYIELVKKVRSLQRQAIVLVPEIALTNQIVSRFKAYFADDVVVVHSKLSTGERHDAWHRLRTKQAGIVIGARSAVFSPVVDLGIIIIDEEHEFTYKQEESPYYHTREVALKRTELSNAVLLLGSATPAIETYHQALTGRHQLLLMNKRIDHSILPAIHIVDMRDELTKGRRGVISEPLRELLVETISRQEQAIILLNRRGFSTFVLCRECGHVMRCANCAVSLVYHNTNILQCHYCNAKEATPDICPKCGSRYIRFFGTGTQKLEMELANMLPSAKIIRMDQDTTSKKLSHDRILGEFAAGHYNILLGTQMVAKGHDFKNVTAVGIITVDSALNIPDFRAAERAFSLLTQAAGRAGRGDKPGYVIVQTYNPAHYAIQAGMNHDYRLFYQTEVEFRRELRYPPFSAIIKLTITGLDEIHVHKHANDVAKVLSDMIVGLPNIDIIGPFSAPIAKVNKQFRMQLLIKGPDLNIIKKRLYHSELIANPNLSIDVEPISIM